MIYVEKCTEAKNVNDQIRDMEIAINDAKKNSDDAAMLFEFLKRFWFLNDEFLEDSVCALRFGLELPNRYDFNEVFSARLDRFSVVPCYDGLQIIDVDHRTRLTIYPDIVNIVHGVVEEDESCVMGQFEFDIGNIRVEMNVIHFF